MNKTYVSQSISSGDWVIGEAMKILHSSAICKRFTQKSSQNSFISRSNWIYFFYLIPCINFRESSFKNLCLVLQTHFFYFWFLNCVNPSKTGIKNFSRIHPHVEPEESKNIESSNWKRGCKRLAEAEWNKDMELSICKKLRTERKRFSSCCPSDSESMTQSLRWYLQNNEHGTFLSSMRSCHLLILLHMEHIEYELPLKIFKFLALFCEISVQFVQLFFCKAVLLSQFLIWYTAYYSISCIVKTSMIFKCQLSIKPVQNRIFCMRKGEGNWVIKIKSYFYIFFFLKLKLKQLFITSIMRVKKKIKKIHTFSNQVFNCFLSFMHEYLFLLYIFSWKELLKLFNRFCLSVKHIF